MALSSEWDTLLGDWSGINEFRLMPDDDYASSPATLAVERGPGDGALVVRYTWSHENSTQGGLLVITVDGEGAAQAIWLDSFHQQPQWLELAGGSDDGGRLTLAGTYAEVWGWRIFVDPSDGVPAIVMKNVPPGEEPYPVVRLIVDPR